MLQRNLTCDRKMLILKLNMNGNNDFCSSAKGLAQVTEAIELHNILKVCVDQRVSLHLQLFLLTILYGHIIPFNDNVLIRRESGHVSHTNRVSIFTSASRLK